MKADQLSLELIALKYAINEIERDITTVEQQRQLIMTRRIQIGEQLTFDFQRDIGGVCEMTR